jgi:ParB-like chromosome segregation protein Spo0J
MDRVFHALLDQLKLDNRDRAELQRRGLKLRKINYNGYKSLLPYDNDGEKLLAHLLDTFGDDLVKVPWCTPEGRGSVLNFFMTGLLVPCRDNKGRIVDLKVQPASGSGEPASYFCAGGGPRGQTVHVPRGTPKSADEVDVAFDELEADIVSVNTGRAVIGCPGVDQWEAALDVLQRMGARRVRLLPPAADQAGGGARDALAAAAAGFRDAGFEVVGGQRDSGGEPHAAVPDTAADAGDERDGVEAGGGHLAPPAGELMPVRITSVRPHPEVNKVPPMTGQDLANFQAAVRRAGRITDPIVVQRDGDGYLLLDGRHRLQEAEGLGLEQVDALVVDLSEEEQQEHVHRAALCRRQLTEDQRAVVAARLQRLASKQARKERASKGGAAGGRGRAKPADSLEDTSSAKLSGPAGPKRSTRKEAAQAAKVSEPKVKGAQYLERNAPELLEKVSSGELSMRDALRQAKGKAGGPPAGVGLGRKAKGSTRGEEKGAAGGAKRITIEFVDARSLAEALEGAVGLQAAKDLCAIAHEHLRRKALALSGKEASEAAPGEEGEAPACPEVPEAGNEAGEQG